MSTPIIAGQQSSQPEKKSKTGCWIASIVGLIVAVLGVGGCVALGVLGFFGVNLLHEQSEILLNANPVIQERIGTIEDLEFELIATGEIDDDDTFVYSVKGAKGSGKVTATFDTDVEVLESGTVEMSSGETYDLFPVDEP